MLFFLHHTVCLCICVGDCVCMHILSGVHVCGGKRLMLGFIYLTPYFGGRVSVKPELSDMAV